MTCGRPVENNTPPSSHKYPQRSDGPYDDNRLIPPNGPFCMRVNYSVVQRAHGHTQHAQSPMRSHGLWDLSCWWALMCSGENRVVGRTFLLPLHERLSKMSANLALDCFGSKISRSEVKKRPLKDRLNRSSERYVFYVFNFAYMNPMRGFVGKVKYIKKHTSWKYACICLSSVYESWLLDRCRLCDILIQWE